MLVISAHAGPLETEVLAGIEEEGVPFVVDRPRVLQGAVEMAVAAAGRSSLSVGVGIDADGRICVQHDKLVGPLEELCSDAHTHPTWARMFGHNAARIVVGIPLIEIDGTSL
ncbi:hypothetical protein BVC93_02640 [Mycobacterium sp. MS1601]|nr:hypothetical protein BVC93_02640 [Mycobacterium sp. MS1601]